MTARPAIGAVALGVVVLVGTGCDGEHAGAGPDAPPVIVVLGDSITYGYTGGGAPRDPVAVDAQGGFPGRLDARLGDRAHVLNRGIGGATTGLWLTAPDSRVGAAVWSLVRQAPWFDPALEPRGPSVAVAVTAPARPDVVVVLLGVNDLLLERKRGQGAVDVAVAGLVRLVRQLRAVAGTVLVATPLPNHRDPPALVHALGARIHATFPDALPVGERFAALDWEALLGDKVHPTPEGHARLARIMEALLVERGLVASTPGRRARIAPAPTRLAARRARAYQDLP